MFIYTLEDVISLILLGLLIVAIGIYGTLVLINSLIKKWGNKK